MEHSGASLVVHANQSAIQCPVPSRGKSLTIFRAGMGYSRDFHRLPEGAALICEKHTHDIVFVGHWERHAEDRLALFRAAGFNVAIWGSNWWRAKQTSLRSVVPLPA